MEYRAKTNLLKELFYAVRASKKILVFPSEISLICEGVRREYVS